MKIDELMTLWATDCHIDQTRLASESANVPMLHSKYYTILIDEKLLLMRLNSHRDELMLALDGFYSKTLTIDELKKWELVYSDKKVLRADFAKHILVHPKMIEINLKIGVQTEKCKFLEDVLKMIHNRNFTMKNIIDIKKFDAGQ
jgi:hypothetical protein